MKSKLLSVFISADACASLVGWWSNFKINILLMGWEYVVTIKPFALEMVSSQLRKNSKEGKAPVSVRYQAKSRFEQLVSDASSILAHTKTGLAGLNLHPLTRICLAQAGNCCEMLSFNSPLFIIKNRTKA